MKLKLLLILLSCSYIFAQESEPKGPGPEPLELPNFIITGVEQLNVQSGIKQLPKVNSKLTPGLLDSLNSFDKQQFTYLSPVDYENEPINKDYKKGFVRGDFGSFATLDLEGGFGFNRSGYELYGTGGFTRSNGWVSNSEFSKANLKLSSDYIAPDKYLFFGGSRTRTSLDFKRNEYNLYAVRENDANISPSWGRETIDFALKVDVEGSYEGFQFNTGAGFRSLQLMSANTNANDNQVFGFASAKNLWRNYMLSGNLLLDFHSIRGSGVQFIQADAVAEYLNNKLSINANAGFQLANNSNDNYRGGFLVGGELEYRISKSLTFDGKIRSGLNNNTLTQLFENNPYLTYRAAIDFPYEILNLNAALTFHPYESFAFTASGSLGNYNRYPIFKGDSAALGEFNLLYEGATIATIKAELYWDINDMSFLTVNFESNQSMMDYEDNFITYLPKMKASANYRQIFSNKFGTKIGFNYIGNRYADIDNNIELDPYLDLNLQLDFSLNQNFNIYVLMGNLLNSDIMIWDGYAENGIYGRVGARWHF